MYGMSAAYDIIRQGKKLEDDPRYQREKGTIFIRFNVPVFFVTHLDI